MSCLIRLIHTSIYAHVYTCNTKKNFNMNNTLKNPENSEKYLEKKLTEKVGDMGGLALKFASAVFTAMPDRIVLMPNGRLWFVETKSKGEVPKPRQRLVHSQLRGLGFEVRVTDTAEKLHEFFNELKQC